MGTIVGVIKGIELTLTGTIYQLFAHPYGYGSTQVPLENLGATLPSTLILTCRNPQPYRADLGPIGQEYIRAQLDHRLLPSIKVTRLVGPLTDWYNTFPILGELMVVMTSLIRPKGLVPPWERHIAVIPTIDCTCPRVVITVLLFTQDDSWHHDGLLGRLKLTEPTRNAVRQLVIVLVVSPAQPTMAVPSPTYGNHGRITRPQDRDGSFGILDVLLRSLAAFLWETRESGVTVTLVGLPEILAAFPPVVLGLSQPTDSHILEARILCTMRIFLERERVKEREEANRQAVDQLLPFSSIESDQVIDQPPVSINDNYNSLIECLRFLSAEEYKLQVGSFQYSLETEE